MKNKKSIYFLLPVVLIIWALIIYKVFNYRSGESKNNLVLQDNIKHARENTIADTFSLKLDYPDPFLKKPYKIKQQATVLQKPRLLKNNTVNWPEMHYYGLVKSRINGETAISVDIERTNYILTQNEVVYGMRVISITTDSIVVKKQGETKTIRKY